jgi:hypothetical protein
MGILGLATRGRQTQVMEPPGQWERAVLIVERNVGGSSKKVHPPQPLFDRGREFSLQCGRPALWLFGFSVILPHEIQFYGDTFL